MKNFRLIILNLLLLIISFGFILPDLLTREKRLKQEFGTLREVYIETYKYKPRRSFTYREKQRLVLVTIDRTKKTFKLSDQYKIYWPIFQKPEALGKELRIYLRTNNHRTNPLILELDKKRVYDRSSIFGLSLFLLVLTFGVTIYSVYKMLKPEEQKIIT